MQTLRRHATSALDARLLTLSMQDMSTVRIEALSTHSPYIGKSTSEIAEITQTGGGQAQALRGVMMEAARSVRLEEVSFELLFPAKGSARTAGAGMSDLRCGHGLRADGRQGGWV